jgi:hypothetical protein
MNKVKPIPMHIEIINHIIIFSFIQVALRIYFNLHSFTYLSSTISHQQYLIIFYSSFPCNWLVNKIYLAFIHTKFPYISNTLFCLLALDSSYEYCIPSKLPNKSPPFLRIKIETKSNILYISSMQKKHH